MKVIWSKYLVLTAVSLFAVGVAAQDQQRTLEPGEIIEIGGGQSVEILQCKDTDNDEKCEVRTFQKGATPKILWLPARLIRAGEERVKAAKRLSGNSDGSTNTSPPTQAPASTSKPKPPMQTGGLADALTEEIVKQYVTRKEVNSATGVGSAPKSVTVTFESMQFGTPRKANERDRITNGITGETVFPVRVQYTPRRRWGNGDTTAKKIHYGYEFYKDSYGAWDAYLVGPVN